MKLKRSSGILLHPTSLPGRFGIGDLGAESYKFIDWLAGAAQTFWQIMPLGPTGYGDSPYSAFSAFAGNTNLVSPERLRDIGLLTEEDLNSTPGFAAERVEYGKVIEHKRALLDKAFDNFKESNDDDLRGEYEGFQGYAAAWLEDWALFAALKDKHNGEAWHTWDAGLVNRTQDALSSAREDMKEEIERHKFYQFVFFEQWLRLKRYAYERGVRIIGDMPIFVAHNSSDVWARQNLFKLEDDGTPQAVAGVPPDAFSKTGQLWGNPLYDWDAMRAENFKWWVERVRETFKTVDVLRLDHFRGFAAYWEVPAAHETAEQGRWVDAPGRELFETLRGALGGELSIIAEDLGTITPDVHALRDEFEFPGMRVLQFAFGGDPHDTHLPHNYTRRSIVYTGTHDNDTVRGWFDAHTVEDSDEDAERLRREREYCLKYLDSDGAEIQWDFIRAAMSSVAEVSIIPLQDVLGLGTDARMNTPASAEGNWAWRFQEGVLTDDLRDRLKAMTELYARAPNQ